MSDAGQTDRYEREEVIGAPMERVWAAISEPEQLRQWFAEPTYQLEPGGEGLLKFRNADDSEHLAPVEIVAVEPPNRFAFRWRPYTTDPAVPLADQPSTLIEITLADKDGETRVRIVESGFSGLPAAQQATVLRDNTGGWDQAFRGLADFLAKV